MCCGISLKFCNRQKPAPFPSSILLFGKWLRWPKLHRHLGHKEVGHNQGKEEGRVRRNLYCLVTVWSTNKPWTTLYMRNSQTTILFNFLWGWGGVVCFPADSTFIWKMSLFDQVFPESFNIFPKVRGRKAKYMIQCDYWAIYWWFGDNPLQPLILGLWPAIWLLHWGFVPYRPEQNGQSDFLKSLWVG